MYFTKKCRNSSKFVPKLLSPLMCLRQKSVVSTRHHSQLGSEWEYLAKLFRTSHLVLWGRTVAASLSRPDDTSDFFLWRHLKSKVYATRSANSRWILKGEISRAARKVLLAPEGSVTITVVWLILFSDLNFVTHKKMPKTLLRFCEWNSLFYRSYSWRSVILRITSVCSDGPCTMCLRRRRSV